MNVLVLLKVLLQNELFFAMLARKFFYQKVLLIMPFKAKLSLKSLPARLQITLKPLFVLTLLASQYLVFCNSVLLTCKVLRARK